MEISLLLLEKIFTMLIACFVGFIVVRGGVLSTKDSKVVSKIVAYVCSPCAIVSSYLIEFTEERLQGMMIAFALAVIWHIIIIALSKGVQKVFHLNNIERASIIYSNAGYLVIPVVYAVLGPEWVIYTSAYAMIQTPLLWTHCKSVLCDERKIEWKKVLLNPNFIAIYIGMAMFGFGVTFPTTILTVLDDFGGMIGTISMFVIGMLIGNQNLKEMFTVKSVYVVSLFRLVVIPFITIIMFAGVLQVVHHPDIHNILLVILWAACAPVGAMVTQLSQIYNQDSEYASKINLVSILFCIITMPIVTYIYEWMSML
ncbi:MAG: AEC family transporter [Eubacteriales bacterium]